ncbi:Iron uptake protein A1 [Nymphon striatum]|nr:Iron uptake protein A1 [Nymphon striatum]
MTKAAKNKANAQKLMEFLTTKDSQKWYAEVNYEYPVLADAQWSDTLTSWSKFKADSLNLSKLGELNADAVKVMDKAELPKYQDYLTHPGFYL